MLEFTSIEGERSLLDRELGTLIVAMARPPSPYFASTIESNLKQFCNLTNLITYNYKATVYCFKDLAFNVKLNFTNPFSQYILMHLKQCVCPIRGV